VSFKKKEKYYTYQEDLGFAKELNILRDDFYYQTMSSNGTYLVNFMYKPLDVMSGDAYSARRINKDITFYLVIDGMGKGLSASLTTMIMTSFTNHIIDQMLKTDSFEFSVLINETMEYIKPILLDEESLSLDYIAIDTDEHSLYYAKFGMPVLLMEDESCNLVKIKSNNPPLSKWQDTFNINRYDIEFIRKFLLYTDGIVENPIKNSIKTYASCIEKDFLESFTKDDLKDNFLNKIEEQEDDITFIYITKLNTKTELIDTKVFNTSLEDVDNANEWYSAVWSNITNNQTSINTADIVFTELFMNAYEHGNLGIKASQKHTLLDEGTYFDELLELEKRCDKKITVDIKKTFHNKVSYIITEITDDGVGFDTRILSKIFRNSQNFNGRGVFVSRKNSVGIYFNAKGNSVLFINKVED